MGDTAVDAMELSYQQGMMSYDRSGQIVSKQAKQALREQNGYCLTCPGIPVQLFEIRKSKLNPLWSAKRPKNVDGESKNGVCLRCKKPALNREHSETSTASRSSTSPSSVLRENSNRSLGRHNRVGATGSSRTLRCGSNGRGLNDKNSGHHRSGDRVDRVGDRMRRSISTPRHRPGMATRRGSNESTYSTSVASVGHVPMRRRGSNESSISESRRRESMGMSVNSGESHNSENRHHQNNHNNSDTQRSQSHRRETMSHVSNTVESRPTPPETTRRRGSIGGNSLASKQKHPETQKIKSDYSHDWTSRSTMECQGRPETSTSLGLKASTHSRRSSMSSCGTTDPIQSSSTHSRRSSIGGDSLAEEARDGFRRGTSSRSLVSVEEESDDILDNLASLIADMGATGDVQLLTDVVLDAMSTHKKNVQVQAFCIDTAADLCRTQDCTQFVAARGHTHIFKAMKQFRTAFIYHKSCMALAALAAHEHARQALLRDGVCEVVDVALTKFLGEEAVAEAAIQVLRSLSFEADGSTALVQMGMSRKVVEVMHCNMSSACIQQDGCAMLSNLSVDVQQQKVKVVDRSVLEVVIAGMAEHQRDPSVMASACFALKNLTYEPTNLTCLARTTGVLETLATASRFEASVADATLVLERTQLRAAEDQSLEEHVLESVKSIAQERHDDPDIVGELTETLRKHLWSRSVAAKCVEVLERLVDKPEIFAEALARQIDALVGCSNSAELSGSVREKLHRLLPLLRLMKY